MTRESSRPQAEPDAGPCGPAGEFEARLRQVGASPASVLLEGESGSGKSAAARRLHAYGSRATGPIIEVSLAALSPTLVEAELFGHEEGAFTGAHKRRSGRFVRASGGTLVLDGIESLGADLQVKLLRVLQEQVVEPLGGEEVPIDVRVVATSTRDLQAEVEAGRFREDLYYRLAVITLRVPPLRVRLGELEGLLDHFLAAAARRLKVEPREFSPAALEALRAHSWPGNLRELENAVERVLVLAPESRGPVSAEELEFLGEEVRDDARELAARALALGLSVEVLERAMIEEALVEQRGNLSAAARQLGLSRRALDYRRSRDRKVDGE
jgi:DNA-binding NtrC family response regulator